MIDYILSNLFQQSSDKQWTFESDNYTLTNDNFVTESLELQESMCGTSEFQIGTYSSSQLRVQVIKTPQDERFIGERFSVSLVLDNHYEAPFNFCDYTVISDKITSDHRARELVMHDDLYKFTSIDIHGWYNNFITDGHPVTIKALRDGFFEYLSEEYDIPIEQETTTLINDNVLVYKTTDIKTMLASDLLKCILHINACNGMLNRSGQFRYIYLPQTGCSVDYIVYDRDYYACQFEEYQVASFNVFKISETSSRAGSGMAYPGRGSELKLSGNILWYKAKLTKLQTILNNIDSWLHTSFNFVPFSLERRGNPCVECGDVIQVTTDLGTFTSIIISRTLTGIIALKDEYKTDSDEFINAELDLGNISDTTIGYIGDSAISNDEGGESYIDQANCAWKLRSYPVNNETGERYYTYLTKNKHLIVSNSETDGHSASNDKTDECTIGSKNYPWKAGYFNELFVGNGSNAMTVQEQFIELIRNIGFRLLNEPSEVSLVYDPLYKTVNITWKDPVDITTNRPCTAIWAGTVVVRSESPDILHRWNGELIVNSTERDEYYEEPLVDDYENFVEGETYYYGIFPYDDNKCYRFTKIVGVEIIPMPIPDITSLTVNGVSITAYVNVPDSYEWSSIKLVYKRDSTPVDDTDGTVVTVTESGDFTFDNLNEEKTYYFRVFSVENGTSTDFASDEQHKTTGKTGLAAFRETVKVIKSGGESLEYEEVVTITQVT